MSVDTLFGLPLPHVPGFPTPSPPSGSTGSSKPGTPSGEITPHGKALYQAVFLGGLVVFGLGTVLPALGEILKS